MITPEELEDEEEYEGKFYSDSGMEIGCNVIFVSQVIKSRSFL